MTRDSVASSSVQAAGRWERLRRYLIVCWVGVACGVVLGAIAATEPKVGTDTWLVVVVFVLAIPWGITLLTLVLQMIEMWRWRCLVVLVFWVWPPLGMVITGLAPVAFLCFATYRIARLHSLDTIATL